MEKTVSQIDAEGYLTGFSTAYEDPMNPGEFLMPAGSIDTLPPEFAEGSRARWWNNQWIIEPPISPPDKPVLDDAPVPERPELEDAPLVPDPPAPGVVIPEAPEIPLRQQISIERERRFRAGCVVILADGKHIRVEGDDETVRNLPILKQIADMRIEAGYPQVLTRYRDADDIDHEITQPQVVELWLKSVEYGNSLYQPSWDLKAMDPIPDDLTEEKYWPLPVVGQDLTNPSTE